MSFNVFHIWKTLFFLATICINVILCQSEKGNSDCPNDWDTLNTKFGCANDGTCQRILANSVCYRGVCCVKTAETSSYGSSCTSDSQCSFENSECRNLVCYCRSPFIYDTNSKQCLPFDPNSAENLTGQRPSVLGDNNRNIKDSCRKNQILVNNICLQLVGYTEPCKFGEQCNFKGAECLTNRCLCPPGKIYNGRKQLNGQQCVDFNPTLKAVNDKRAPLFPNVASMESEEEECADKLNMEGVSECFKLKNRCWHPKWEEKLRRDCLVTCGICVPTQLNQLKKWLTKNNGNRRVPFSPGSTDSASDNNRRPSLVDQTEGSTVEYPELLSSLNRDINPCDDFYGHVCDGFMRNHEPNVKKNGGEVSQFTLAELEMDFRIFSLLEINRQTIPYNGSEALKATIPQLYEFYDSCTDMKRRNYRMGVQFVLDKLSSLKKSVYSPARFNTDWLLGAFPRTAFFRFRVGPQYTNSSKIIMFLGPTRIVPEFTNTEKLMNKDPEELKALKIYLKRTLNYFMGDDKKRKVFRAGGKSFAKVRYAELKRRVDNFIYVETERLKIEKSTQEPVDPYDELDYMTLAEFQQKHFPSIDWLRYFSAILPSEETTKKYSVSRMIICVFDLPYFQKINRLVKNLDEKALSDYLEWQIILTSLEGLDQRLIPRSNLRDLCKDLAGKYFPHILSRMYANRYINEKVSYCV
ncbi:peptidase family m13 domain-containing protein [Ditylenchus destructor]|uniref:Peptidase family m13 domain-containing protein n=1 Tax=Ditylenchus destructor TaxID=166010 RepID=A0AAD4MVR1_9BILA|nr:peptidase family m13 domain-containing protein [Ditylenchus destructor]